MFIWNKISTVFFKLFKLYAVYFIVRHLHAFKTILQVSRQLHQRVGHFVETDDIFYGKFYQMFEMWI